MEAEARLRAMGTRVGIGRFKLKRRVVPSLASFELVSMLVGVSVCASCRHRRPSHRTRPIGDQGEGARWHKTDAARPSGGPNLHGHVGRILHRPRRSATRCRLFRRESLDQWRNAMAKWKIATALALLATVLSTQVVAHVFSDPDAFQAQHPDRDVLNGGALTPAGRAAAGLDNPRGSMAWGEVPTLCLRAAIRGFRATNNSLLTD
jgi:hypothetical protein